MTGMDDTIPNKYTLRDQVVVIMQQLCKFSEGDNYCLVKLFHFQEGGSSAGPSLFLLFE